MQHFDVMPKVSPSLEAPAGRKTKMPVSDGHFYAGAKMRRSSGKQLNQA